GVPRACLDPLDLWLRFRLGRLRLRVGNVGHGTAAEEGAVDPALVAVPGNAEPAIDVLADDGDRVTRGDLRDAEVSEPGAAAEIDVVRGGRIAARSDVRAAAVGEVVTHDVPGHAIDADLIPVIALIVGKRAIEYGD